MIEIAFVCMVGGILIGGIIQLRQIHELNMTFDKLSFDLQRERQEKKEEADRNPPRGTYYGR